MITPPKEGKGRPSILSQPLPNDVLIALKYRSEGCSWKKSAEKSGMTYDRLRNYTRSHPQVKEVLKELTLKIKEAFVFGGLDDLEEVVGNVIENACKYGNKKIKVARNVVSSPTVTVNKPSVSKGKDESGTKISSPIIGTAYLAPEPGAKKFVEVGSQIKKGQTVMIVEAMKTMNHVPSTADGIVKKVLVQDGEAVEFGQVLILLK